MDYNNDVIVLEAQIQKNGFNKSILGKETFLIWYILTEGVFCENFTEEGLKRILKRNFSIIRQEYKDSHELNFIVGWALTISFWFFGENLEDLGTKLLYKAYKQNTGNLLYKWAVRDQLSLKAVEVEKLEKQLSIGLERYTNEPLIQDYFFHLLK